MTEEKLQVKYEVVVESAREKGCSEMTAERVAQIRAQYERGGVPSNPCNDLVIELLRMTDVLETPRTADEVRQSLERP